MQKPCGTLLYYIKIPGQRGGDVPVSYVERKRSELELYACLDDVDMTTAVEGCQGL